MDQATETPLGGEVAELGILHGGSESYKRAMNSMPDRGESTGEQFGPVYLEETVGDKRMI